MIYVYSIYLYTILAAHGFSCIRIHHVGVLSSRRCNDDWKLNSLQIHQMHSNACQCRLQAQIDTSAHRWLQRTLDHRDSRLQSPSKHCYRISSHSCLASPRADTTSIVLAIAGERVTCWQQSVRNMTQKITK